MLRLYGPAALSASTGSSRVAHGSIVFLNQCYSNATPKNEISLQNRVIEKAALQQSKNDPSSVLQPVPLPFPLPLPPSEPSSPPRDGTNVLNIRKEVFLKLSPSSGSLHVLIINGADCVGRGVCRGAYPKLFRQADILSTWCEQNLSLSLSRCVHTVLDSTVQNSRAQYSTVEYSTVQYSTVQCSRVQCSTVQYRTVQYSAVQYSTVQNSRVQHSTVQYDVLCCAVLCCAVLCCAVLCCAVLCCAVLCCTVLCCAAVHCAVLCCAVLHCAVLFSVVQCSVVQYSAVWCVARLLNMHTNGFQL